MATEVLTAVPYDLIADEYRPKIVFLLCIGGISSNHIIFAAVRKSHIMNLHRINFESSFISLDVGGAYSLPHRSHTDMLN